jgi:hypothetical protein
MKATRDAELPHAAADQLSQRFGRRAIRAL